MSSPETTFEQNDSLVRRVGGDLLQLAMESIDHGLTHGTPAEISTTDLRKELTEDGASFVTLKSAGNLRGCIGSAVAWRALALDVSDNAFNAAFRDRRFPPLEKRLRETLSLTVSVLSKPAPMTFESEEDLLSQLRVGIDGLIIRDAGASALFLPAVWESLPERAEFLGHLKTKAGLPISHWSSSFTAHRFTSEAVSLSAEGVLSYRDE